MKKDVMEILNCKKKQVEDIFSLPVPTSPQLYMGYLRRKADAKYFLAELLDVISIAETLDEVQLVQVHVFRQSLRKENCYVLEYNGRYCLLATNPMSSCKTLGLLAISTVGLL